MVRIIRTRPGSRPLGQKFFSSQWGRMSATNRAHYRQNRIMQERPSGWQQAAREGERIAVRLTGLERGPNIYYQERGRRRVTPWYYPRDFTPPHSLGVFPRNTYKRKDFRTYMATYRTVNKLRKLICYRNRRSRRTNKALFRIVRHALRQISKTQGF